MNPNNSSYKQHNQQLILLVLIDGNWHRNMELKKETRLTPRTLSKHLNELEKELHWIERKEDTESGKYPHPVFYRATRSTIACTKLMQSVYANADQMEIQLKETKDPLKILHDFHKLSEYYLTLTLGEINTIKYMNEKQLDAFLNFTLCQPYEVYIKSLVAALVKAAQFGARYDINQLIKRHKVWIDAAEDMSSET